MEFLVEFIMELLGEIWGETVNSKRVPKVIRTVVFCLFWVPLLVLAGLLLWLMISGRNTLGCVLTGACVEKYLFHVQFLPFSDSFLCL